MIKFFRKIRQNLLSEGKTGKYFKYAIGEILLVVIGILIALQINNWNEEKKTNLFQHKILVELHSSALNNIHELNEGIKMNEEAKKSCEIILYHLANNIEYQDSLDISFSKSLFWYKYVPDDSSYESVKTYGLHIIKNDSIRNLIPKVNESKVDWIQTREKRNHDFFYLTIQPVSLELFESTTDWKRMTPMNYNNLNNNKKYLHILNSLVNYRIEDIIWYKELLVEMKHLEKLLQSEINKGL